MKTKFSVTESGNIILQYDFLGDRRTREFCILGNHVHEVKSDGLCQVFENLMKTGSAIYCDNNGDLLRIIKREFSKWKKIIEEG
jgi:hypothetical protein